MCQLACFDIFVMSVPLCLWGYDEGIYISDNRSAHMCVGNRSRLDIDPIKDLSISNSIVI